MKNIPNSQIEESKLVLEYESLNSQEYSVEYKGRSWTADDLYTIQPGKRR